MKNIIKILALDVKKGSRVTIQVSGEGEEKMAEMACFSIDPSMQGAGLGTRILKHMEQRAKTAGLTHLFVLTTRAAHWFLKNGFVAGDVDDLPANKKQMYNWQRRSQIFIKKLS